MISFCWFTSPQIGTRIEETPDGELMPETRTVNSPVSLLMFSIVAVAVAPGTLSSVAPINDAAPFMY